jgi:hypothetical protein
MARAGSITAIWRDAIFRPHDRKEVKTHGKEAANRSGDLGRNPDSSRRR